MSTRVQARAELADPERDLYAAAPGLCLVGAGLLTVVCAAAWGAGLAWHAWQGQRLTGIVLGAAAAAIVLWRTVGSPGLLLLALATLLTAERALARLLLPDPRPPATAHERLGRRAAMTRARRTLRCAGLGAGWIGSGAAVLDRWGRVRLLRRP